MAGIFRQEVVNVKLAELLNERGIISVPETILKFEPEKSVRMPDLIFNFHGLRTVIEGEFGHQPDAMDKALKAAYRRVEEGIAHIGIAVVYPPELRTCNSLAKLKTELAKAELRIAVITEVGEPKHSTGNVSYLESVLRHAFEELTAEDVVAKAVAALDAGIEKFAAATSGKKGILGRLALAIGVRDLPQNELTVDDYESNSLPASDKMLAVSRISGLILLNAMIFQEVLAEHDGRIKPIDEIISSEDLKRDFHRHWKYIIEEIDYLPLFNAAVEVIKAISANKYIYSVLQEFGGIAQQIVRNRAALRHDLMGRVYHRLLAEQKYLATYYTRIPSATLLLKLAIRGKDWPMDWANLTDIGQFRVGDIACGTGTLLMAAAESVTDNYINAVAAKGEEVDIGSLHKCMIENVLYGYDVLISAIHLTASTLALRAPNIAFDKMNLFSLPLGGEDVRLGSIEFLGAKSTPMTLDLFGAGTSTQQASGKGVAKSPEAHIIDFDLCVMNPPFTRSVGGNLLFGGLPEIERNRMQTKLKQLVKKQGAEANITAGLGSVFVAIADQYIKPNGRIALVLPKALLSGVAWGKTRELLSRKYTLEYIISSHDPERWNFSESTDLSEVMVVARRKENGTSGQADHLISLNLWRNLETSFEALAVANDLLKSKPPGIETGQGAVEISLNGTKVGEALRIETSKLNTLENWMLPVAFAQNDLIRFAYNLIGKKVKIPGDKNSYDIPLCQLSKLGDLGPDRRDIHDGFAISESPTSYPAFWGHDADSVLSIEQDVNCHLSPLPEAKKGRSLRKAEDLWPKASCLLIAERLWLKTQRTPAIKLNKTVLSNVWWPLSLSNELCNPQQQKALILWLNSTLGLILLLVMREETRGAWVDFKKPTLLAMPVVDLTTITKKQLKVLAEAYDENCKNTLKPLPEMVEDAVREAIDKAVSKAFGLPDLSPIREILSREPIICLKRL